MVSEALGYVSEQNFTIALANLESENSLSEFIAKGQVAYFESVIAKEERLREIKKLYKCS